MRAGISKTTGYPPALPRTPFLPTCRSRVRKADCRIQRRRDPSFAKARPFPACSTIRISPSCRSPPDQGRSRIPRSARRRNLAAYTSTYFLMIEAHCSFVRHLAFLCVRVVLFRNSRKVNARRANRQRDLTTANWTIDRRKAHRRFRQHIRRETRFFRRVDVFPLRCEAIAANAAFGFFSC